MKRGGFTLIEVLIVIAIIGILTAIAVPGFLRWRASTTVTNAAYQFGRDVQRMRTEAKRFNDSRSVLVASGSYALTYKDTPTSTASAHSVSLPSGVSLSASGATTAVGFYPPYGTTDASAASFVVTSSAFPSISKTVRITGIFGRVIIK